MYKRSNWLRIVSSSSTTSTLGIKELLALLSWTGGFAVADSNAGDGSLARAWQVGLVADGLLRRDPERPENERMPITDFSATQPPQVPEDAEAPVTIPCRVVARVKIPVTLVFDVIRALNEQMTAYEEQFGEIQRPGSQEDEDEFEEVVLP